MDSILPTDAELVTETLAGAREPFGQLYDRYARLVASVVAGVSGDWAAVDDMVQECFLRAYRKLTTLRDPARFGSWIVGIARQVGRERRRASRRDRHEYQDPSEFQTAATLDFAAALSDQDQINAVMQRVADLCEQERLAIHAYFLEQQTANEGASILGMSRSGFYATLRRALARLAAQLKT